MLRAQPVTTHPDGCRDIIQMIPDTDQSHFPFWRFWRGGQIGFAAA